jgi:hypothetical protein
MTPKFKNWLIGSLSVAVILGSAAWIYFTQLHAAKHDIGLHRYIGEVLAEETVAALGKKGHVVAIAIDTREWPELKTQIDAFKEKLKKSGDFQLREYQLDTKDQPKYGVGTGLSGRRYVRTVNKNPEADLFVSFVGAPKLTDEEVAELKKKPKLIVESRSGDNVPGLFDRKLLTCAVVSRFQFPAPGPEKPHSPAEWFTKRYQVLTADTAAKIPKSTAAE